MSLTSAVLALGTGLTLGWTFPAGLGFVFIVPFVFLQRTWLVTAFIVLGLIRSWPAAHAWQTVAQAEGEDVRVVARVSESRVSYKGSATVLRLERIGAASVSAGSVSMRLLTSDVLDRGERVGVICERLRVATRPSLFAPRTISVDCPAAKVESRQRGSAIARHLDALRRRFISAVEYALPEVPAGLAIGLVLGETQELPAATVSDFRRSGTSHVMALSGYNVSILVALLLAVLPGLIGRRSAFVSIGLVLVGFLFMTGVPPSLLRATVMASLLLLARLLGRRAPAGRLLGLSLLFLLSLEPILLLDVGFVLSVAATAGLIISAERFTPRALPRWIATTLGTSLAAFVWTLPVSVTVFGRLSPVAPLANLLIMPLVPILFFGSLGIGALGMIAPTLSSAVAAPVIWLANLFVGLVHWSASLPGASLSLALPNLFPLALPAALLIVLSRPRRPCPLCQCPPSLAASYE